MVWMWRRWMTSRNEEQTWEAVAGNGEPSADPTGGREDIVATIPTSSWEDLAVRVGIQLMPSMSYTSDATRRCKKPRRKARKERSIRKLAAGASHGARPAARQEL